MARGNLLVRNPEASGPSAPALSILHLVQNNSHLQGTGSYTSSIVEQFIDYHLEFSPPLVIHSSPPMYQYTTASTISRITTIILVILAWIAFACWIFYYTILMAAGITLIYVIKRLERGICNGRTQVLDGLEHEETGIRRWRRMAWAWWDKIHQPPQHFLLPSCLSTRAFLHAQGAGTPTTYVLPQVRTMVKLPGTGSISGPPVPQDIAAANDETPAPRLLQGIRLIKLKRFQSHRRSYRKILQIIRISGVVHTTAQL
ncbi:hypothetical protein BGX38DRAFT_1256521 [Terfezia claveryi]|nr:hypothetical protein BGX38DRAFT_1256521 [Terfezia claveryi]